MPDDGAFMASIRARAVVDEDRPKPDPDSWTGRLLARRQQRGWTTDRYIAASQFAATSGEPWPNMPGDASSTPAGRTAQVVDLDDALP